jgi:tetratricopeptide (TPR) repeat protein
VLGLSFAEDERSRSVPPRGRALITRDLLVELFKRAVGDEPTLVVLDDTHWFDSASWAVAEGIQRELPGVMMVIAQRPLPADEKSPEQLRLSATPDAQMLRLEPLSPDATRQLVCLRLRARVLEPDVERLFLQKAEGHPFFTEELAHALRDRGLVRVEQGVCRFTGAGAQGESTLLPNTVQVMVSSRIDQLPIPQQLTIKIASIFGQPFDLATLRAIHPAARDDDTLLAECQALADTNLLRNVAAAAPTYAFKHALIQEVAYELLPYAQRRQLHARVAAWYEQNDVPAGGASVLAYHWSRAEVADRALFYLDKAADDALNRFANEEAERFYAAALAMDATRGADAGAQEGVRLSGQAISARDSRRVRWHRRCGDASANLGRWAEARTQFERALMLVGERSTSTHWAVGIAGELTTQCVHRLTPRLVRRCPPGAADLQRETVRAYERMGAISYLMEQTPSLFHSLLAALNRAEELGTDADTALVYADVGNIAGMIPVHRLARRYNGMARAAAARLGESPLLARVLGRASVYRVAIGDWNTCDDLARSMEMCDELGDPYQWEESAAIRARAAHLRGEFRLAVTLGSEIRRRARDNSSSAHEVWGLDAEAWGLWYLGDHQRALDLANRGLAMMADAKRPDRVPMLDLLGVVALARLSANDVEGARAAARQAADALDAVPRPGHMATIGISAVVEACVALWELEPSNADAQATANTALGHLMQYVRLNPTSLPRVHLWQGCVEWLKGRHRSAHRQWQRCIDESQRLQQPYEEARARYEIGRRCDVGDVTREEHLLVAERIFDRLGVEFERRRVVAARAAAESLAP